MAYLETVRGKIYYEIHGDGAETLLILNGIMMSSSSWGPFVETLKEHTKVVLMDFYDQGKSTYLDGPYDQTLQVEAVKDVVAFLALKNFTLLGISYGGEIAMQFAAENFECLKQLILANTTDYTDLQLKAIGGNWVHAAETCDGGKFFKATIPTIYSRAFYEAYKEWLDAREVMFSNLFKKPWYDGFIRLVVSAETHDAREVLNQISVPTLIIGADGDLITPIDRQESLSKAIKNSELVVIKDCGHASMYEKPNAFFALVVGFMKFGGKTFTI
jgi:pimeloyl-ACP methyl ester carboxylesterase